MLTGLRVGGQFIGNPYRTTEWPEDPAYYAKWELLVRYGMEPPFATELVSQDAKNFQIPAMEIARAEIHTRRRFWTGPIPNSGLVRFDLRRGKRRRFILLGRQDPASLQQALNSAGVQIDPLAPVELN